MLHCKFFQGAAQFVCMAWPPISGHVFTGKLVLVGGGGRAVDEAETDEAVLLSGGRTSTMPSLLTGLGRALQISDTSTGKLMVWPDNALWPKGSTISFIKACTLDTSLCSITVRHANSGGISSTRMLFTTDIGGIFPLFKCAIHLVHNHTESHVPSTSISGGRGHVVSTWYRCDSRVCALDSVTLDPPLGYVIRSQLKQMLHGWSRISCRNFARSLANARCRTWSSDDGGAAPDDWGWREDDDESAALARRICSLLVWRRLSRCSSVSCSRRCWSRWQRSKRRAWCCSSVSCSHRLWVCCLSPRSLSSLSWPLSLSNRLAFCSRTRLSRVFRSSEVSLSLSLLPECLFP